MKKKPIQRAICCPCGCEKILALGLCATCYTLKRQDEEYFGGHRETVLARDGHLCRIPGCTSLKRGKRSLAVHHREPGNNNPDLMITLCLGHHAGVRVLGTTMHGSIVKNLPESPDLFISENLQSA